MVRRRGAPAFPMMPQHAASPWGHSSAASTSEWMPVIWSFLTSVTGLSLFASVFSGGQGESLDSAGSKVLPMLVFGSLIEVGRRLCVWFFERFRFQYYVTAQFNEGDPTYDWIILLLTQENVWKRAKDFRVTSKTSQRKWGIGLGTKKSEGEQNAEYVPTYDTPQLWRWNGYWIEVTRNASGGTPFSPPNPYGGAGNGGGSSNIFLTIYTFDMKVLSDLVEAARRKYFEVSRPYIMVHSIDSLQPSYGPGLSWNDVKQKARRPLESIILNEGVLESIIKDAREFIDMDEWYIDAGIPHRRGYLLHGPPGTGKTSTIFALAGELGMEIYSLSLASNYIDDATLQRAAATIPKNSIFLIEDIDCAFPREDEDEDPLGMGGYPMPMMGRRPVRYNAQSSVTLSGLLNVLDGVGSEEGKLFFATTNHVDHLDPALIRPGRIDLKLEYNLATRTQAAALFRRFYPAKHIKLADTYPKPNRSRGLSESLPSPTLSDDSDSDETLQRSLNEKRPTIDERIAEMAELFAKNVPDDEFSTAELQGYLLIYKKDPLQAVEGVAGWVEQERVLRAEKEQREEERKLKAKSKIQGGWPSPPPMPSFSPPITQVLARPVIATG